MKIILITVLFTAQFLFSASYAQQTSLVVKVDKPLAEIQPTMWGIFFEDINFAADGGIYAELVKNGSFEFDKPLLGWKQEKSNMYSLNKESGAALIINRGERDLSNPRFARITVNADTGYGLSNEGFRGIGIKKDMLYNFSVYASQQEGSKTNIRITLADDKGNNLGSAVISPSGKEWKEYKVSIKATATEAKAKLNLWFEGKGTMDIDRVSLFPNDTWKNRPKGLRSDLVQLLADMKPGFLRFPGGCIVEGKDLSNRYQWKNTVGDPDDRKLMINRWNTEFNHRPAPDYYQSFGLGFYEYFLLSEDIDAQPLPILNCGMACQFNSAEVVPLDQLDPYIQDALDLIEFANGSVETKWGKLRTDMGHKEPFNLKFLGVGNEQWGSQYIERYKIFQKAIKAKYPGITLISSAGPFPQGDLFDYAHKELKEMKVEIVDEHYYNKPEWFLQNAARYDKYDRKGFKIFAGEYAAQSVYTVSPDNKNNWQCALAEAAFMTGLERNADLVHMCSYAPLLAHADGWQWTPDLIWFDNLKAYATPNYYVQKLFSTNKGTQALSALNNNLPLTGQNGLYSSAVFDKSTGEVIIKLVNYSDKAQSMDIAFEGVKGIGPQGKLLVLKSDLDAENSFSEPAKIFPKEETINLKGKKALVNLSSYSLTVLRVKVGKL
jgi:alpha-L-arabinofuranosidase